MPIQLAWSTPEPRVRRAAVLLDGASLDRAGLLARLGADADDGLRAALTAAVRDAPWPALCWECPPVHPAADRRGAAFALVESPALARSVADAAPFASAFRGAGAGPFVTFPNLGRDAWLVAPVPGVVRDATHLAVFLRAASDDVADRLWRTVARAVRVARADGPAPRWLSTAGLGVSWLHVRVDTNPKYYRYRTWADPAA